MRSCAVQKAANESRAQIEAALQGTDMVFVTVSLIVSVPEPIVAASRSGMMTRGEPDTFQADGTRRPSSQVPRVDTVLARLCRQAWAAARAAAPRRSWPASRAQWASSRWVMSSTDE